MVKEQLQNLNTIYDLMALCCSYIFSAIESTNYDFTTFDDEQFELVYDQINGYVVDKEEYGTGEAFVNLRSGIYNYLKNHTTIESCYAVVKYIDELVPIEMGYSVINRLLFKQYTSLNEQYQDKVRIYPKRIRTFKERSDENEKIRNTEDYTLLRNSRKCYCSVLDRETLNYIVVNDEFIKNYPTKISVLNANNAVYEKYCTKQDLTVGVVPLYRGHGEKVLKTQEIQNGFIVEQLDCDLEQELSERYADAYMKCQKAEIDFLVFPEMLITNNVISNVEFVKETNIPLLIFNGSEWKDEVNKCIVATGNGEKVTEYCKKEPFEYTKKGKKYREKLDVTKNKEYVLIDIEGIGRIGIAICKDLISDNVKMFHKKMGTDILLVPEFTVSRDMSASAKNLATEYNCMVIEVNACAAITDSEYEEVSFITIPAKDESNSRTYIEKKWSHRNCMTTCEKGCQVKQFRINFFSQVVEEGKRSYKVNESCI